MSNRPVVAEILAKTLSRVWCPMHKLLCKDLGGNRFLFTFKHVAGWRKALHEGPWMFNNDLLVTREIDLRKTLDEMEFKYIPIWIRVLNLPVGKMDVDAGRSIGDDVGEALEVDVEEDGTAFGQVLRVRTRIDISLPLQRGFLLEEDEEEGGVDSDKLEVRREDREGK